MRVLVVLLSLMVSASAFGWWNEEWTQRKQITVNTTAEGANTQAPLNDVPVLVRLHSGNFPQFLNLLDQGADFRFVSGDDQAPLKFHVERFDPVAELAFVWVKLPVVAPQSDKDSLYLYFGNPNAPKADDPGGTWDVNTVAVFHFSESTGAPGDSTAYKTAITSGTTLPFPAALIGGGATLPGTEPLVLGAVPQLALDPATGWTFETWVRLSGLPTADAFLLDLQGEGGRLSLVINQGSVEARFGENVATAAGQLTAAAWHHVALVVAPNGMQIFLDGALSGNVEFAPAAIAGPVSIGGSQQGDGLLAADIDELRISNIARSPDWIGFAFRTQGTGNDRALGYGLDDSGDGAGAEATGSFGIIFQNVFGRPEAWVEQAVIILCGLMMLAAGVIMFLKAVALSRAAKATREFLVAYGGLGQTAGEDDLGSLYPDRRKFGDSPLWRVYHVGIDEIHKRLSPSVGARSAGVDSKALNSIRAAMDAAMVREGQRLNSQLVLLTIAISGGPFIGLFGTVVGVMVTFAAIAATGDVNIAAIAPGMAAALLATVAGLGVAIPALFGYNWLSSRAKEQVADMRVFSDELTARFSEQYET